MYRRLSFYALASFRDDQKTVGAHGASHRRFRLRLLLEPTHLCERGGRAGADDQVVEHAHVDHAQCAL